MSDAVKSIAPLDRRHIIAQAKTWLGTPFQHQARRKGKGVDCIGFVWCLGVELGLKPEPIPANYSGSPTGKLVIDGCERNLVKCAGQDSGKPIPGSVMVLWGFDHNTPQHFAVIGGDPWKPTLIHAFSKRGAVVEMPYDVFFRKRFVALYDFPGAQPWVIMP